MKPHSTFLLFLEMTVCATVLGFMNPKSPIRLGGLLIIYLCMWQCITTSPTYLMRSAWASLVGGYAVTLSFHYIDIALLSPWPFERIVSATKPPQLENEDEVIRRQKSSVTKEGISWKGKLKFGLSSTFTARFCGTPHEVRHVPRFSNNDPNYVPYRTRFIRNTVLTNIPLSRRFHDVSRNELLMRTSGGVGVILGLICSQRGFYNLFALVGNLLGLSAPRDWPPFHGSPLEAYSLRRFWSLFWHQANTHKFNSISDFILRSYARAITIFALSAVMHFLIDISAGIPVRKSGTIPFFCTQAFDIVLEDAAMKMYSYITVYANARLPVLAERVLGFTWVAIFLIWPTPMCVYPMMYRSAAGLNDAIIPFSTIGLLNFPTRRPTFLRSSRRSPTLPCLACSLNTKNG
ncbi:membrane bound O-acyl transferase family-domain-containing protein [Aspergillus caelatus]|uniref:Membrane bound O-acyl transferase family-domain-containing protein n=1 Tax=Aspergillus caelatus TaxID=61420 RepID=A0A5N6ZZA5_9EURO|nr:membrane bound O-acyl transferase family-domain-containing protein [Aspergillus caelatus]KAE8362862.1 membrane bound O-acyl transferase family-domain-containing protein [Aspergillus caelatus]